MVKCNRPINLNGIELRQELLSVGIQISNEPLAVRLDGNNDLWLDIAENDAVAAKAVVAAHNGTILALEPTVQDKLTLVGLSIDDLKTALGLGGN